MIPRTLPLVALLLLAPLAHATPLSVTHTGYLLDATGAPVTAMLPMSFRLFPLASAGTPAWTGACSVGVTAGTYTVALGDGCGGAMTETELPPDAVRWLEVTVDGTTLTPRHRLAPAPHAQVAARSLDVDALRTELGTTGTVNDASNPVAWSRLRGVPADVLAARAYTGSGGIAIDAGVVSLAANALETASGGRLSVSGTTLQVNAAMQAGAVTATSLTTTGAITAGPTGSFVGSGAGLTNVPAAAVTGTLALANLPSIPTSKLTGALIAPSFSTAPAASLGAMYFDTLQNRLLVYDGTGWLSADGRGAIGASTNPGLTCRDIRERTTGTMSSGPFWIDPDGAGTAYAAMQVWCDMTTGLGGWTLVAHKDANGSDITQTGAVGTPAQPTSGTSHYKLSNAIIGLVQANSTKWRIFGKLTGKTVQVSTTGTTFADGFTTNSYAGLNGIVIGRGMTGCGADRWAEANVWPEDGVVPSVSCWAYPTTTNFYDFKVNPSGGNGTGVTIWLR